MPSLWNIQDRSNRIPGTQGFSTTPPDLVPSTKSFFGPNFLNTAFRNTSYKVDVVNNFYWTYSNLAGGNGISRAEVPNIELVEKRILTNALVNQAIYSTGTAARSISDASTALRAFIGGASDRFGILQGLSKLLGGVANNVNNLVTGVGNVTGLSKVTNGYAGVLGPYDGLYFTEPTGWTYNFPYFDNTQTDLMNNFSDQGNTMPLLGQAYTQAVDEIVSMANTLMLKPGTYIEKTKFYDFPIEGDPITFSFPLINTGSVTFDDVVRNWQLVFLLTYQNRPSRLSRDLVEPASIYEINIPGIKYSPFAYMKSLKVDFVGSRRSITIPVNIMSLNSTSPTEISTIIPDAYNITITLQCMVAETRNIMFASLTNKNNIVSVNGSNVASSSSLLQTIANSIIDTIRR